MIMAKIIGTTCKILKIPIGKSLSNNGTVTGANNQLAIRTAFDFFIGKSGTITSNSSSFFLRKSSILS